MGARAKVKKQEKCSTNSFVSYEVQVKALFLDYDGTLAPMDVAMSQSVISGDKLAVLKQISSRIPIAIISTKDLAFIVERTPFARGWSGIGGLETRIGEITTRTYFREQVAPLIKALLYAKCSFNTADGAVIEEKHDSEGVVVGFCLDWRQAKNQNEAKNQAARILAYCQTLSVTSIQYESQPFLDVFLCPIDKGKALVEMKKAFGLADGVLYLGDSIIDNSAFQAADISIGVVQEETSRDINPMYFVKFDDLPVFLEDLLAHSLQFNPNLARIYRKR